MLDEITAARPEPERSEADIESAGAAFRAIAEEAAPGCTLDVSYDAGTDAYWSDMALHDSFLMPAEGKTGADFIALSFTCSPAEGGEPLWAVEPGKEAVVVLMRRRRRLGVHELDAGINAEGTPSWGALRITGTGLW